MTDTPSFSAEELRLYAEHLELLRAEDAKRTALIAELLVTAQAAQQPRPETDEQRTERREDKRDWFAGLARQGMTASPELMEFVTSRAEGGEGVPFERLARQAYRQADAMLKERQK